jgi:predicted AlkP superfamily pyrophosphatase or phosphodiesterase
MTHVLTVFIDGLKFESLKYMPFLNSFSQKRKIWTDLGYSVACHASMYSGVRPNKHLSWFIWKYSPDTSPFKWINKLKIDRLPHNAYSKYICYRISSLLAREEVTAFTGIPFLWNMPLKDWHYFDLAEKRYWTDPRYMENYPTIFDILTKNSIEYDLVGMPVDTRLSPRDIRNQNRALREHNPREIRPWTYLFIGYIDLMSHFYGQDSNEVQALLKEIDKIVEQKYRFFEEQAKDFVFFLFSDHGHIKINQELDLYSLFKSSGKQLEDYIFFIDANYVRFWFKNEREEKEIHQVISKLDGKGFILTSDLLRKYNVDMPDNRYGDLIFYLDAPYIFGRGEIVVMGKRRNPVIVSMHGYRPDFPCYDGVIVSNKPLLDEPYVKLVDIMPSILSSLDIPIPKHAEGKVIWK